MLLQEVIYHTDHNGQLQKYVKKQKIGSGGFAKCYLLINPKTQQKYAGKVMDSKQLKDKSSKNKILQEIEIHKTLNHPNIVKFYHHFEYQQQIYMIIELCQNNTLKQFIKNRVRITEFQAKVYMHQIIAGIQYLHHRNIIHRDIKLGNLFLNIKMQVKIGDFGLSRQLKQIKERRFTTCGTPNYIAPEILKQTGHSFEADIWAIGIVLYAMLVGKPPFESDSVENTYRKIKNNIFQFPKEVPLSNQAKSLIKGILDPNPKTRSTIQQIKKHQFMNKDTQSLPQSMPSYTISIPPQRQFLKQFVNEKNMRLLVYPKKIYDSNGEYQTDERISKLSRVQSLDKKLLLKFQKINQQKQLSSLNRGRYIKALKLNNLSKSSLKNLKGVRSATSIGSTIKRFYPETERNVINSPIKKTIDDDLNQIICYYDLSQKYGIGYLLSNGNHGVIFNDQTSLTAVQKLEEETQSSQPLNYIYYEKTSQLLTEIPQRLIKKHQILKICKKKLQNYRKTNILIAYKSETFVKKWIKLETGFMMKLNNGIMQFFWDADSIALRNYKWVRWRINQKEGEGQIGQQNYPSFVSQKVQIVKSFLLKNCSKSKAKC